MISVTQSPEAHASRKLSSNVLAPSSMPGNKWMNIDMTFWDEVFKTGLFLEKKKHFCIYNWRSKERKYS
jgi:hypothetical protein